MDPRFVIDVLARLSTLEGTVKCHDSNATKLIGALTATKNLDDRHNANIAMLQRRIEQLEANATAQAESHRSQVEPLQQRIQTLEDHARRLERHAQRIENQAQHSATLVQTMLRSMTAAGTQVSPPAPDVPLAAPPWAYRCDPSSAHSSSASSRASPRTGMLVPPSFMAPPAQSGSPPPLSAPMSAAHRPMHTVLEGTVQQSSSTSALLSAHRNDAAHRTLSAPLIDTRTTSSPLVDRSSGFKRRSTWQQERSTAVTHPLHPPPLQSPPLQSPPRAGEGEQREAPTASREPSCASFPPHSLATASAPAQPLQQSTAGACMSASGASAIAASAAPSAAAGAGAGIMVSPASGESTRSRSHSHDEHEPWEGFASMLDSFDSFDAPTAQAEEEIFYNDAWFSGAGERR